MSDLEEAETAYKKACEQIEKWSGHAEGSMFARQQVEMWTEVAVQNAWCLPGNGGSETSNK